MSNDELRKGLTYFEDDNMLLISYPDAAVYARRIIENGQTILGFEGFLYDQKTIEPLVDCVAGGGDQDFSIEAVEAILDQDDFKKSDVIEFTVA